MTDLEDRARAALDQGDHAAVFEAANEAMQAPGGPGATILSLLGQAFAAAGMPLEAAEAHEAAAERAGPGEIFHHRKAAMICYEQAGDSDRAFLAALAAQKAAADDPDVVYVIARELSERGETDLLAHYRNRLTASDDPRHLELAKLLIGNENRNPFNLTLFRKLALLDPDDHFTRFKLMTIAREFCDYDTIDTQERWMRGELAQGRTWIFEAETPYANLLHCGDPGINRLATNNRDVTAPLAPGAATRRRAMPHTWAAKIRVGYLSSDFSSTHATMRLLRRVLELHDRSRFDIVLYDHTPSTLVAADDGGRAAWGGIVPIHDLSDDAASSRIRADGIDILVDLKGHTGGSRARILNGGAAPVQAAWLGFPGSTCNIDLDYIIGDRFVLPETDMAFFHEQPCRLPDSYQPNDPLHRPLPSQTPRHALGLPEDRFVFASFNAHRKITPTMVALWAQILHAAPTAVLWVMISIEQARQNFLARIAAAGIDPGRIVFAGTADYPDHIARLQAADIGLDTFPYNGHTTTSDMLWAGLPVVTARGSNFASRVSESLLNAVGLPDLVAADPSAYAALAASLANDPVRTAALRSHLQDNRLALPLFDAERFCRHLEAAFEIMRDRAKQNEPPTAINMDTSTRTR
jgi:predicted O-linked N-acetylglucosamine transferase (SPINDLY family)